MKDWKLNEVGSIECTMDNRGVYTVINRIVMKSTHKEFVGTTVQVRVDIMSSDDEALQSFIGNGNDVRKAVICWLSNNIKSISWEHASYIGYEISRAMLDENFVQV